MNVIKKNIPSSKGNLAAVIHYPGNKSEKLAILCPGWLDSKDYPHLVSLAEDLSLEGYTVVRFDPSGTWESVGTAEYTNSQYLEDVKSVVEYMLQQENYKHILLGGHSRGGLISILYAVRDPRISMVLGIMPPYSLKRTMNTEILEKWKESGFRTSTRDIPGTDQSREFRIPYSHAEDAQKYNALDEVGKLHAPLILITGELDKTVLPEDVKRIFDNANEPKKFVIITSIGHDYRRNDEEIKIVNENIMEQLKSLK